MLAWFFPHSQPPKKAPPSGRPFQLAWQGQPTANAVSYDAPAAASERKRMAKTRLFAEFRGTPLAFGLSFSHPATNPAISRLPPAGGAEPERTGPRTTLNTPRDAMPGSLQRPVDPTAMIVIGQLAPPSTSILESSRTGSCPPSISPPIVLPRMVRPTLTRKRRLQHVLGR